MALALLYSATTVFEEQQQRQRPSAPAMASRPEGEVGRTTVGDEEVTSGARTPPNSSAKNAKHHNPAAPKSETDGGKDNEAGEDIQKRQEGVGKKNSNTRKRQRLSTEASSSSARPAAEAIGSSSNNNDDLDDDSHAVRTAAWLDRARTILSRSGGSQSDVEGQLRELEQLIREGASAVAGRHGGRMMGVKNNGGLVPDENSTAVNPSVSSAGMVTATGGAVHHGEVSPSQNRNTATGIDSTCKSPPVGPGPLQHAAPPQARSSPSNKRPRSSSQTTTPPRGPGPTISQQRRTTPTRSTGNGTPATPNHRGPASIPAPPPILPVPGPTRAIMADGGGDDKNGNGQQQRAPPPQPPPTPPPLRRGKWTVEEEAYVARVIRDFNLGYLDAPPGTTLRTYLSEKLHCDPMRITKKFTGESCIGKRVFHPANANGKVGPTGTLVGTGTGASGGGGVAGLVSIAAGGAAASAVGVSSGTLAPEAAPSSADADGGEEEVGGKDAPLPTTTPSSSKGPESATEIARKIETAQAELRVLERRWRRRMEMQEREACSKRAAAAVAAAASSIGSAPFPLLDAAVITASIPAHVSQENRHALARTAAWLHRAGAVLRNSTNVPTPQHDGNAAGGGASSPETTPTKRRRNLEHEMREVKELIHEGDAIRRVASAVIPRMFDVGGSDSGSGSDGVGVGVAPAAPHPRSPVVVNTEASSRSSPVSAAAAKTAAVAVSTSTAPGAP